ncbi:glycoside hydrolase family 43 protein [Saccharopolyspora sp. 7B]|uniref:glycoside hydrolase family 43 protein n=1 Tax=Saccharopolyspora sp. 7B TaxID=2877240 RepID=UPI001CD30693|nr:glycoside hydrolase family 43 protein [Saccharopolyspora sp. 7B]MCA1280663.1 glycoside hydrolase family 43 protein [Saccharopolyspora sp. 7B]
MSVRWSRVRGVLFALPILLASAAHGAVAQPRPASDATYFNDAALPAADPFVLRDPGSGDYFAYSTDGADPGYAFAIYRSPDLVTWQRIPGGALDMGDGTQWGRDWFWAPEVYHNPATGRYFLFYSARLRDGIAEQFGYADFEEPSKVGVAVSDSPAGPFRNIQPGPIDYHPYDPDYHDVNLLMDAEQKKPPETLEEGMTAPLGTYIPFIDPNVFFDDGRIVLYFSRNAYRNWVWDHGLGKYVEESNVLAVELTSEWWDDPAGATMPRIAPEHVDANRDPADPPGVRKDGYVPIIDYASDPQQWENAHVDDYAETGGAEKDRRWSEGSTVVRATARDGRARYFLTYSANNFANSFYGVGYAVADDPLGPWRKSPANPVLAQDAGQGLYSTGHGSVIASPDSTELYYVHHGRPSAEVDRRLYTSRLRIDPDRDELRIDGTTEDRPVPSGVAPYAVRADRPVVEVRDGEGEVGWRVGTASGSPMPLGNPLNRVLPRLDPGSALEVVAAADGAVLRGTPRGVEALRLTYQRARSGGGQVDVHQGGAPVEVVLPVAACGSAVTGRHDELVVPEGVTCLRGAEVRGSVRVEPGASLLVLDSTVGGSVLADSPGSVWVSGGRIGGSVRVRGATGPVRLDGTEAGASVVLVDGDSPVVAGPSLGGGVRCRGNASAPVDEGRPNSVAGSRAGECGAV